MKQFLDKQKAIDLAMWQNHNHRFRESFGVVPNSKEGYIVFPTNNNVFQASEFEPLPVDCSQMNYHHIRQICMDVDPLPHWEEIHGMFSTTHSEVLRFIVKSKLPLEKFIRYELASQGCDENAQWIGFDKAEELWLK